LDAAMTRDAVLVLVPATGLNLFTTAEAFVRLITLGVAACLACWRVLADSSARTDVRAASGPGSRCLRRDGASKGILEYLYMW
jgi:hypothetical protein